MDTSILLAVAIGLVSGVLSGMFGIGGGIVTTPALRLFLGTSALVAVGTPLPVILPSALAGATTYVRSGVADVRAGLVVGLIGAPVAVLGAMATKFVGGSVVLLATAALIGYVAVDMFVSAMRVRASGAKMVTGRKSVPRLVLLGVLTGAYSGFLGLGGGFVLVPGLNRLLGFEMKRAIATSLVAVAVLSIPGSITHLFLGNVDVRYAVALAVGVVPGAVVGARITLGAREQRVRLGFALLLVVTAAVLAATELRLA